MKIFTHRDLTIIEQSQGFLVAACDSCGGIGPKPGDIVPANGQTVGYFTAHVVLAELIAAGAEPFFIANALAVERNPVGNDIISGVRQAAEEAGIKKAAITGSTEENIPVTQTAMGITAMGSAPKWPMYESQEGDVIVMAGTPRVGEEVTANGDEDRLSLSILNRFRNDQDFTFIHEIIPAGSRGAMAEATDMASTSGLNFIVNDILPNLAEHSAGPATVAVISLPKENLSALIQKSPLSISVMGHLS